MERTAMLPFAAQIFSTDFTDYPKISWAIVNGLFQALKSLWKNVPY